MGDGPAVWIRHEVRPTERRAPVVPDDARRLVENGLAVTVEESPQRVFPTAEYAAAGCRTAAAGAWVDAGPGQYIVGLKELPETPEELRHRHVFFGHAYKGQAGGDRLLRRFLTGGGQLLDLESLVDADGRRLAAFGYWAGYVGAAMAVLHLRGALRTPLAPGTKETLDAVLRQGADGPPPRALVIGALGRCGRGAHDALRTAGITPTCWDLAETRDLDRSALREHDILVNTVLASRPVPPFVTPADLDAPARRLRVISDVSCDVDSPCNVLPIYDRVTTWQEPVRRLRDGDVPVDLVAIDNLPSMLPREASESFSAELTPLLMSLVDPSDAVWRRCQETFDRAARRSRKVGEPTNA